MGITSFIFCMSVVEKWIHNKIDLSVIRLQLSGIYEQPKCMFAKS